MWQRRAIRRRSSALWPRRVMITLKLKSLRLIVSAKFQSAIGRSHHPTLMSNYQTLCSNIFTLSILWMVCCLSILRSVWCMRVTVVTLVVFEICCSFLIKVQYGRKVRYKALLRWWVLRWKDDNLVEEGKEDLFLFLLVRWICYKLVKTKEMYQEKSVTLKCVGKRARKGNKDIKKGR